MKKRLNKQILRCVFYTLLTFFLCVGCNNKKSNNNCEINELNNFGYNSTMTIKDIEIGENNTYYKDSTSTNWNAFKIPKPLKYEQGNYSVAFGNPTGFENEIKLEPHQLAFIEKCKKEGKLGCWLTINNQKTYISFYFFNPSVGNAH